MTSQIRLVPRPYQIECVESIWEFFRSHETGNPICALPTGTGKSVVIAMFLESVFAALPNQKILIATHVKELVQNNFNELLELWPEAPAGIHSAGLRRRDTRQKIIFAGIASIQKKANLFGHVNLLLIDECHLVSPKEQTMYMRFIDKLKLTNPDLRVVGFSATPWRHGVGHLTETGLFTDVCFDNTCLEKFNELIADGYLCTVVPKQTKTMLDTSDVHSRAGDFIASELQLAVDREEVTEAALNETMEIGFDRKHWLIFASGIEHGIHIRDMLESKGVDCNIVHSKMTDQDRDNAILDFKSGNVRAIVNYGILTTGFNYPEIDLIVMLRPTGSVVLWIQMLGRGTRPYPGKENCMVLDFGGNTLRLGPINDPVLPRKKGEKTREAPVKLCYECMTYNHIKAANCTHCKKEFVFKTKIGKHASNEEVIRKHALVDETPVIETFRVDFVTYHLHHKNGAPPIMRASYVCGLRMFREYICLEHEGGGRRKAIQWWNNRRSVGYAAPATVNAALAVANKLPTPTYLRVQTNLKWPEVKLAIFGELPECYKQEYEEAASFVQRDRIPF